MDPSAPQKPGPAAPRPLATAAPNGAPPIAPAREGATTCPHCGESRELAKVKGCIRCLQCGFKFDCNGW